MSLVDIDQATEQLFKLLMDSFWPGPLTIIVKANQLISPKITANTGFVGIRHPKHPTAQELIRLAGRPIVAPSANVFCHVSPTSPVHVFNDLYDQALSIIDDAPTEFGIESTVLKVVNHKELQILRNGSVSAL